MTKRKQEYSIGKEWARKRNFVKLLIEQVKAKLRVMDTYNVLTVSEKERVADMLHEVDNMARFWKTNHAKSKSTFLRGDLT